MIVHMAIADAYGAAYEFATKPPPNDLEYHVHPSRADDLLIGEYTDDTQMSIAIMRHLVSDKPWNQYWIAWFFLNEYKSYKIDGYARGFQKFLDDCNSVQHFISKMSPKSKRNGSVMRSVPVGVLPTEDDVVNYSYVQSSVTHATPSGCMSAAAVALASHYYYHDLGPCTRVASYLKDKIGFNLQKIDTKVACDAIETAHAAIWISKSTDDIGVALRRSIDLGGDTDSVAAVSVGLISMRIVASCPDSLLNLSSRNRRSINNMTKIENDLFQKYPRHDLMIGEAL